MLCDHTDCAGPIRGPSHKINWNLEHWVCLRVPPSADSNCKVSVLAIAYKGRDCLNNTAPFVLWL